MFDTVDFFKYVRPFVLFKNFYEICKTICIYKSIFNNESNDRKRINNYLNFLNKTNGQIFLKKSTASNILGWREYLVVEILPLPSGAVGHVHSCHGETLICNDQRTINIVKCFSHPDFGKRQYVQPGIFKGAKPIIRTRAIDIPRGL